MGSNWDLQAAKARAERQEDNRRRRRIKKAFRGASSSNWSEPMGGCDADGNPITAAFGSGPAEGETFLSDGDGSEVNFLDHSNHDHYGPGNGPNNNGTSRGQYTGPGY